MNKDTRFSPLFKTPNRMKREVRGDEAQKTHFILKIITGILCLILIAQIYHKRGWFMNIPTQPSARDSALATADTAADTAAISPDTAPLPAFGQPGDTAAQEGPGFLSRLVSRFHKEPALVVDEIHLLDAPMDSLFRNLGLEKSAVRRRTRDPEKPYIDERLLLPKGKPLPEYVLIFTQMAESRGLKIMDASESERDTSVTMEIWGRDRMVRKLCLSYGPYYLPGYARLAFVLEGLGEAFTQDISALFSEIKRPMTLGLVPDRPFTDKIYQLAIQNGFEILCQIPMENIPFRKLGENAIYKQSNAKQIEKVLSSFSQAMAEAKGYSIFGGGIRIVENEPEILKTVLAHIKQEDKYFIDNSFASRSRVEEIAQEAGVTLLMPLGYADADGDTAKEKEAVLKFAGIVRKTGKGIILFRESTDAGKVLEQSIPVIEAFGIKIVTVSSLYK